MNGKWDLSFLYQSFEDEAFLADLAKLPEVIRAQQAILDDASLTHLARLEKLADSTEELNALADRIGSFIFLTIAVDATNTTADIHEKDLQYLATCRECGRAAATYYGWTVIHCVKDGAMRSMEDIHEEIYRHVTKCLED